MARLFFPWDLVHPEQRNGFGSGLGEKGIIYLILPVNEVRGKGQPIVRWWELAPSHGIMVLS